MKTYLKHRLALFKQASFSRYFTGGIFATLGYGLGYIATTWLILSIDNSISALVWGFLAYWVPNALCSPLAGVITDRVDRKWLISVGLFCCGLTYACLALVVFFVPHIQIYWVYLLFLIIGLFQAFYSPGLMAFIREVVTEKDLLYANANVDLGYQTGTIVGMGLAGALIHLLGFPLAFLSVGILLVLSGLINLTVQRAASIKFKRAIKSKQHSILKQVHLDFTKGLRYLFSHHQTFIIYLTQLFFILTIMTAPVLLAPFAKNILHASASEFGQIEATLTIGAVVGGIFITYLATKYAMSKIVLASTLVLVISLLAFSTISELWLAMLLYFFVGLSLGCWALVMTKAQESTNPDYQGRVQSVFSGLLAVGIILLYLGIHFASEVITIRHIYWIIGILAIVPIGLVLYYPKYFQRDKK